MVDVKMEAGWKHALQEAFATPSFAQLAAFVKKAYQVGQTYPPAATIFKAFDLCPFEHTKVVILGQDPYHGYGQAHGLCFSVQPGVAIPPSLVNIFKEIKRDLGKGLPPHGDLTRWARQGVLLLNATLTVAARRPGSHQGKGWEAFTDQAIQALAQQRRGLVFMLWGAYARRKGAFIDPEQHLVLASAHPSPFSADRGFHGNSHFSQANAYLAGQGLEPIDW